MRLGGISNSNCPVCSELVKNHRDPSDLTLKMEQAMSVLQEDRVDQLTGVMEAPVCRHVQTGSGIVDDDPTMNGATMPHTSLNQTNSNEDKQTYNRFQSAFILATAIMLPIGIVLAIASFMSNRSQPAPTPEPAPFHSNGIE